MTLPVLGGISGWNSTMWSTAASGSAGGACAIMRVMAMPAPGAAAGAASPPAASDALPASLRLKFSGLDFASPIVLLSGCVGFGEEYTRIEGFSNRDAGAVVLERTRGPPRGEPPQRRVEAPA